MGQGNCKDRLTVPTTPAPEGRAGGSPCGKESGVSKLRRISSGLDSHHGIQGSSVCHHRRGQCQVHRREEGPGDPEPERDGGVKRRSGIKPEPPRT